MSSPAVPDQPDDIDPDSRTLPAVERAIERVNAYVTECGDGLYDVFHGAPLYGRDLEVLCRAAQTVQPAAGAAAGGDQ